MRFLFAYPTRSRPLKFRQTLSMYQRFLSQHHPVRFHILMDEDDVSMGTPKMRRFLDATRDLTYHYGRHRNKVHAINNSVPDAVFDVLVLISDDMIPQVKGFDNVIAKDMKRYFPDLDGALHYNDGGIAGERVLTFSIMGAALYQKLGYFYHPDYISLFCDQEFTDVVRGLDKVYYSPQVIVKHKWLGANPDDLMKHNESFWKRDERVYKKRKAQGFPRASVLDT